MALSGWKIVVDILLPLPLILTTLLVVPTPRCVQGGLIWLMHACMAREVVEQVHWSPLLFTHRLLPSCPCLRVIQKWLLAFARNVLFLVR
jgi:hypothetical protein